jgi:hypothetical protein
MTARSTSSGKDRSLAFVADEFRRILFDDLY